MEKTERLRELESRQVELLSVMQSSDAHALKCNKLGLVFADEYPDEAEEYAVARDEYNNNQEQIESIKAEIVQEEQKTSLHIEDKPFEVANE